LSEYHSANNPTIRKNHGRKGDFPGGSVGEESGEGNGNPLQYSCLGNPMDRGA